MCALAGRHRSWPAYIGQQQATSANGRRHRPRHARIKCGVCASGKRHLPTACMHQSCHARIDCATSSVACAHRPTTGDIAQGLHTSTVVCAHRLETTTVTCAHRLGDVPQRQAASAKACTHRTSHVRIWQTTSNNGMQHQPRSARFNRGACALDGRHRPWLPRIGH